MIKDTNSITHIAQKVKGCYNIDMARKSFSKRIVRKIKKRLTPDETQNIIEKEFTDSHNNKHKLRIDFNPHSQKEPTIETYIDYGEDK